METIFKRENTKQIFILGATELTADATRRNKHRSGWLVYTTARLVPK